MLKLPYTISLCQSSDRAKAKSSIIVFIGINLFEEVEVAFIATFKSLVRFLASKDLHSTLTRFKFCESGQVKYKR